jgi:YebC/PmpR family DNA-binding regulatory protein
MGAALPPLAICFILLAFIVLVSSFQFSNPIISCHTSIYQQRRELYMGRAAAVRAATKAKTDGAKAKNNGRFAKKIIMAVKAGGTDPISNRQLAQVIEDAKVANVPKDIITRNIEKAGAAATADYKESVFEFYGHGGVGLLVNVLTDNDNRAAADVNLVAKKNSLKSASTNSVAFKFAKKARIDVQSVVDENLLMELCLESGVDDYELRTEVNGCPLNPAEDGKCVIYVDPKDMAIVRDGLREKGLHLETKLANVPLDGFVDISDEDFEANLVAIAAFDALDDVDSVEHNIDMTDNDNE